MSVRIKSDNSEFPVILGNKNLSVGLCFKKVLEDLKFDEPASHVIHGRTETGPDILKHLIEVETDSELDELVGLMTEHRGKQALVLIGMIAVYAALTLISFSY